jgi:hypothetical protein
MHQFTHIVSQRDEEQDKQRENIVLSVSRMGSILILSSQTLPVTWQKRNIPSTGHCLVDDVLLDFSA